MVLKCIHSLGILSSLSKEPNLTLVREEGAIVAVLKAMEKHPANEALQAEGCWALLVFCSNHGTFVRLLWLVLDLDSRVS